MTFSLVPRAELPPPTPEVERLARLIGAAAAFALVEEKGGTRVYVPKTPTAWLVDLIGEAAARKFCAAHGGEFFKTPLARAWRVLAYKARGMSYPQIARRCGCSEDAVWKILAREEKTAHQFELFDRASNGD